MVQMSDVIEVLDKVLPSLKKDSDEYVAVLELTMKIEVEYGKCVWCGEVVEVDDNFCPSCQVIVCPDCGEFHGHTVEGGHGLPTDNYAS